MTTTPASPLIQVFGEEVAGAGPLSVTERSRAYLDYHGLRSHWYAECARPLSPDAFRGVLRSLPALPRGALEGAFHVHLFLAGDPTEKVTRDNLRGYAVYVGEADGVRCRYVRASAADPGFEEIAKVASSGGSVLSSDERTLLHFASFDDVPAASGVLAFRRELADDEREHLKGLAAAGPRAELDDAICGDGRLNQGVAFLKKPPTPDSCGAPCTAPGGTLMYCGYEPWSGTHYCKLATETCGGNELALVLANRAPAGEIPEEARGLLQHLDSFRVLRDAVLRTSPVGRKYIGYYRLFSRHAEFDAAMVARSVTALPSIYKAVDAVIYGDDRRVVVGPALYDRALAIIEALARTENTTVRSMLDDVRADLAAVKGLTRAALLAHLGRRGGGEKASKS